MRNRVRIATLIALFALSACGGGGGGSNSVPNATPTTPGSTTASPVKVPVTINVHIPGTTTSSKATASRRSPKFVAANTQGVLVVVYATSDTGHTTPIGISATNVASGSAACGGVSGARTCAVPIPAPSGADDFVFTTYDQPPNGATTFPGNANILATGVVTNQTIATATVNVINVTLSGTLDHFYGSPNNYSTLAGVGAYSYTYEYTAFDAANDVILGPYVDVNGNADPIAMTETETGGSGFTKIAVGGNTPGTTATVTSSSDLVTVSYTGGGSAGYGVNFNGVATTGQSNPSTFGPLYMSSTSPAFTLGATSTLNLTAPNQIATVSISEQEYTGGVSVTPYGCSNVVTVSNPTPAGSANETFTVTGGSSGGSCSINVGFGWGHGSIAVTAVGNTSTNVAVPGTTLAYMGLGLSGVAIYNPTGSLVSSFATAASSDVLAMDDAGDVYSLTDPATGNPAASLALYTPGGSTYPPSYTQSARTYTLTNPSTTRWIQASGSGELAAFSYSVTGAEIDVWDPGQGGNPSRTITRTEAIPLFFGGMSHAGNIYMGYQSACGPNTCFYIDVINAATGAVTRTIPETIVSQANQSGFSPNYIAIGADGTVYVTEFSFASTDPYRGLYIYPPTGSERFSNVGSTWPNGIDLDANGNIYIVNDSSVYDSGSASADTTHYVAVLNPTATNFLETINVAPLTYPITVAADGTAWVSSFPNATLGVPGGVYLITPSGGNQSTEINVNAANTFVLWNGTTTTLSKTRKGAESGAPGGGAHSSGFVRFKKRTLF